VAPRPVRVVLLRAAADLEIETGSRPLDDVVAALVALVAGERPATAP
jgi:hypothetical protein